MSIYLYLKQHNTTGLKYLGQTTKDPFTYQGSGKHWVRHIKKHGYDVTTIILYETIYKEERKEQGLYYSDLWNIVDSNDFANLIPEGGEGNSTTKASTETRMKQSINNTGAGNPMFGKTHTEEAKKRISSANKGRITKGFYGRIHSEESRKKTSETLKGVPQTKVSCIICGKTGGLPQMKRYHLNNCIISKC